MREQPMKEEIIIDGVNVNGCNLYCSRGYCMDDNISPVDCKDRPDCEYKQLKRLQAENEEFKKENTELQEKFLDLNGKSYSYYKALEEIREIIDKSCNQCKNEYLSEDYCSGQGDCFKIRQVINEVLE